MARVKVFRCGHSGLYFPGDYAERWGSFYGKGLGPTPVSECLNSQGETFDPAAMSMVKHLLPPEMWMLPVGETYAPVEMEMVAEEQLEAPQEQKAKKQRFRKIQDGQYELIDETEEVIGPDHPEWVRGNRLICRHDDPSWGRIRTIIRGNQEKSPHWAKLQALVGGIMYAAPERKVWA